MTRIVARIEELGYVTRVVDAADRRVARVEITDAGRTLLARSRTRKDAFLARRVAEFTDAERALLAQRVPILERLQDDDASEVTPRSRCAAPSSRCTCGTSGCSSVAR